MIRRLWRAFWAAFWAGYERGCRQAQERRRQEPTRADAEKELRAAMTRYGLTDRDRRFMAGKES